MSLPLFEKFVEKCRSVCQSGNCGILTWRLHVDCRCSSPRWSHLQSEHLWLPCVAHGEDVQPRACSSACVSFHLDRTSGKKRTLSPPCIQWVCARRRTAC